MIIVHRLNGEEFVLNDHHIETMEATPDTVITLMNEKKYVVKETTEQIISLIIDFRHRVRDRFLEKE